MRQKNSKDLEYIKRFQKSILKQFGGKEVNKDQAIKLMKSITSEKRLIAYLNELYNGKKTLTYKDFLKLKPKEGNDWNYHGEDRYQTVQRIMPDNKKNKTISVAISPKINELLHQLMKLDFKLYNRIMRRADEGHFISAASFIRYTKVSPDWIHIDAIQTDFFNGVRKTAMEMKPKGEAKKIISKILGMEEDAYKYSLSAVKGFYPKVKVWTMNTPEMARKAEHIQSGEKVSKIYSELPPKLGFKLINLEQLKKNVRIDLGKFSKEGADKKAIQKLPFLLTIINDKDIDLYKDFSIIDMNIEKYKKLYDDDLYNKDIDVFYESNIGSLISRMMIDEKFKEDYDFDKLHIFSIDLAHQVYNEVKSKYEKAPSYDIIIKIIKKATQEFINKAKEKSNKTIWWANRGMLNEEKITMNMLLEMMLNESKGPGTLFHYTNTNNLKQILQKGYLQTRSYMGDGDLKTLPVVRPSMTNDVNRLSDNIGNIRFIFDIPSLTSGKLRGARIRKISEYPVGNLADLIYYFKNRKNVYKEIDKYKKLGKKKYNLDLEKRGFSKYKRQRIIKWMNYFRENLKDREGEERIYLKNGGNIPLDSSYMKIEIIKPLKSDFTLRQLIRKNKNLFVDNNNLRKILS